MTKAHRLQRPRRLAARGKRSTVIKDVELADLKRMVRTVYRGHALIDPKIAPQLISAAVNGRAAGAGFSS